MQISNYESNVLNAPFIYCGDEPDPPTIECWDAPDPPNEDKKPKHDNSEVEPLIQEEETELLKKECWEGSDPGDSSDDKNIKTVNDNKPEIEEPTHHESDVTEPNNN